MFRCNYLKARKIIIVGYGFPNKWKKQKQMARLGTTTASYMDGVIGRAFVKFCYNYLEVHYYNILLGGRQKQFFEVGNPVHLGLIVTVN